MNGFKGNVMKLLYIKESIAFYLVAIFIAITLFCTDATSSTDYFPTHGWRISNLEAQGIHSKPILEILEEIKEKRYIIQSVSIVRNGYLVFGAYIYPFKEVENHKMYSATKSVTFALIGIAIDKGFIKDVNQTITELVPNKTIFNLDELKISVTLRETEKSVKFFVNRLLTLQILL